VAQELDEWRAAAALAWPGLARLDMFATTAEDEGGIGMLSELRQLWSGLPNKAGFVAVAAAWVALFHFLGNSVLGYVDTPSVFGWLDALHANAERTDSDDAFGRYVPWLVLVLLVVRRRELMAVSARTWPPGLALIVLAVVMHAMGFLVQQTRVSIVAFLVGLYGIMGLAWGPGWLKAVFFPYFLLAFSIPISAYLDGLTFRLRLLSTWVSTAICQGLLSIRLTRVGTSVEFAAVAPRPGGGAGRAGFLFDVAPACSGIRSLTIVTLLTVVFAWLNLRGTGRRVLLVLCSVPLALLGNVVRLIVTFGVADVWGQEAASKVETKAGFITFAVALAGVFSIGRLLREPDVEAPAGEGASGAPGAADGAQGGASIP